MSGLIRGVVVTAAGRPARGARVFAVFAPGPCALDPLSEPERTLGFPSARTDACGAFTLRRGLLSPEARTVAYTLFAVRGRFAARPLTVALGGGSAPAAHLLALEPASRGALRVRTPGGAPVAGARILLCARFQSVRAEGFDDVRCLVRDLNLHALTDERGVATAGPFSGLRRRMRLWVWHPGFVTVATVVGDGVAGLLKRGIRMRRGIVVRGRVVGPDGEPRARVPIFVSCLRKLRGTREDVHPRSTTGEDGTFDVAGVPLRHGAIRVGEEFVETAPGATARLEDPSRLIPVPPRRRPGIHDLGDVILGPSPRDA